LSRQIIRDVVIPIVQRQMPSQEYHVGPGPIIQDPILEEFLEEEMRKHFGVIGANECQHLKEQLEEAKKNDPYAFEFLVRQLVRKYVRLAVKIRTVRNLKESKEGPPDRFSDLRRRYNQLQTREDSAAF
jgi:hypothetical protein